MDHSRLMQQISQRYLPKSELLCHLPLGVSLDDIWEELQLSRKSKGMILPLKNCYGDDYRYVLTDNMVHASEIIVGELLEHI